MIIYIYRKMIKNTLELLEIAHIYSSFIFGIKITLAVYVLDFKCPYNVIFITRADMTVHLSSPIWQKSLPSQSCCSSLLNLSRGEKKRQTPKIVHLLFLFELFFRTLKLQFRSVHNLFEVVVTC